MWHPCYNDLRYSSIEGKSCGRPDYTICGAFLNQEPLEALSTCCIPQTLTKRFCVDKSHVGHGVSRVERSPASSAQVILYGVHPKPLALHAKNGAAKLLVRQKAA